jgi:heat shock protein HslJ
VLLLKVIGFLHCYNGCNHIFNRYTIGKREMDFALPWVTTTLGKEEWLREEQRLALSSYNEATTAETLRAYN